MKNLHIFVTSKLDISGGGIETWIEYFVKNIQFRNEYEFIYIYGFHSNDNRLKVYQLKFHQNVKFLLAPFNGNASGVKNIWNFIKVHNVNLQQNAKFQDHVIVVGSVFLAPLLVLINRVKKRKNLKTILWVRSKAAGEMKARKAKLAIIARQFEKYMIKNSDIVITNGEDTYKYYNDLFSRHSKKIHKIFNAVDFDKYSKIKIEKSIKKDYLKIVFLGRYVKAKGFDCYIDSIKNFYNNNQYESSVRFEAYGHGNLGSLVNKDYVRDNGIYTQQELYKLLIENDAFVFLNRTEHAGGLSHALLEVMAAGKLVIAWENEVHCQVLNKKNSILVPEGDIKGLTESYITIIDRFEQSKEFFYELRKNSRKVAGKYSIDNHINEYFNIVNY